MLISFLSLLVRAFTLVPTPGVYELISVDEPIQVRELRKGAVEVIAVKDGWVRFEILPKSSFVPRSMRIAAFNLTYKRVD